MPRALIEPPPALSVVVPVRDEVDSLETLHREIDAALAGFGTRLEIVLVDDGSRDGSLDRMQRLQEKDARIRVLSLNGHHGQSAALDAGFRAARAPRIATLDADLQNDPADLPAMLALLEEADVVDGVRAIRRDGWRKRWASRIGNAIRNRVTGLYVTDIGCGIRVMRAELLARVRLRHGLHRFLPALLAMEGARIVEIQVSHRPRRYGATKYGVRDRALRGLIDLLGVRWMQARQFTHDAIEIDRVIPFDGEA